MLLWHKLLLSFTCVVLFAAVLTGMLIDRQLNHAREAEELERLTQQLRLDSQHLLTGMQSAEDDVRIQARSEVLQRLIQSRDQEGTSPLTLDLVQQISGRLADRLAIKQQYLQFRFLERGNQGKEVIRVDRLAYGDPVRIVPSIELQSKGNRSYFTESLDLPKGQLYISAIDLNVENGQVQIPHTPVIRFATPIYTTGTQSRGIMVLNVAMEPAFHQLRQSLTTPGNLYLVNEAGDYLIHPDSSRAFGWQLGKRHRMQDDYPELTPLLGADAGQMIIKDGKGQEFAVGLVSVQVGTGPRVSLFSMRHLEELMAPQVRSIHRATLAAVLPGLVLGLLLALLLARSIARPVEELTQALQTLDPQAGPPRLASTTAEMSVLAKAIERLVQEGQSKAKSLETEIEKRRLAESEAQWHSATMSYFHSVIQYSEDAIITSSHDGLIISWNPAATRLFGYTEEEAVGFHIKQLIIPEERHGEFEQFFTMIQHDDLIRGRETERRHKSGRLISVSLTISPVRDAQNKMTGFSAIYHDISDRKQQTELFRMAVEASPSGMLLVNETGEIMLTNSMSEKMFGYERKDLVGRQVEVLMPRSFRAEHPNHRRAYTAEPTARMMGQGRELFGLRKNGQEFPVEIGLNPIETKAGRMILCVIVDITERKRTEEEIFRHTNELERSNAELQQFAYIASHDLQEPLRMVASYTELLAERYRGQMDERADKYIRYAIEGARRMQQLVGDLLTFSRMGREKRPFTQIDMAFILSSVLENLDHSIMREHATITHGPMPVVQGDETQLRQLLQNLIGNALKFHTDVPPTIDIQAKRDNERWEFTVKDNGIGIDPQYHERIFQMFQRLHERGRYEGSGIGLAMAKKIVDRHDGRIWVESQVGEGSTFHFTLPALKE